MLKRCFIASACLAAVLGFTSSTAFAKPADLPSGGGIECNDCTDEPMPRKLQIELGITSKGITLKVGVSAAKVDAIPSLDAMVPAFVDQGLQHIGDLVTRPGKMMTLDFLLSKVPVLGRLRNGLTGSGMRDAAEESGAEDPQTLFQDMRSRSVPLGLVEVAY